MLDSSGADDLHHINILRDPERPGYGPAFGTEDVDDGDVEPPARCGLVVGHALGDDQTASRDLLRQIPGDIIPVYADVELAGGKKPVDRPVQSDAHGILLGHVVEDRRPADHADDALPHASEKSDEDHVHPGLPAVVEHVYDAGDLLQDRFQLSDVVDAQPLRYDGVVDRREHVGIVDGGARAEVHYVARDGAHDGRPQGIVR